MMETALHHPETGHDSGHEQTPAKPESVWKWLTRNVKEQVGKLLGWDEGGHGHGHHGAGHKTEVHDAHGSKNNSTKSDEKHNKESTHEAKLEEGELKGFELFMEKFKPELKHILYPCCATHSLNKKFPDSQVTYVDINAHSINAHKKAGHDAHVMSALDFKPTHDPDLLILLNPALGKGENVAKVVELVKPGKYVLCNDYHHTAEQMYENPNFEFVGIIDKGRQDEDAKLFTENLESYVKPKAPPTDSVIQPHRFTTGMDDYYLFRRKAAAATTTAAASQDLPKAA